MNNSPSSWLSDYCVDQSKFRCCNSLDSMIGHWELTINNFFKTPKLLMCRVLLKPKGKANKDNLLGGGKKTLLASFILSGWSGWENQNLYKLFSTIFCLIL